MTYGGLTVEPSRENALLRVRLDTSGAARFVRCDPNADGRNNLADSIWLVNELFRDGDRTACTNAADCNRDGLLDLSDAVFSVAYQFGGGPPPPPPFPGCGTDPRATAASCPSGSTGCE